LGFGIFPISIEKYALKRKSDLFFVLKEKVAHFKLERAALLYVFSLIIEDLKVPVVFLKYLLSGLLDFILRISEIVWLQFTETNGHLPNAGTNYPMFHAI
jgi:hypothetical protein